MMIGLEGNRSRSYAWSNQKACRTTTCIAALYTAALLAAVTFPKLSLADRNHKLTELFETTAFAGSWEVFSKFNWLGNALNFLISAFCLFGLVLVVVRFTLTILYKSNENIFDRVYELKQTGKGSSFAGVPSMFKEVMSGNYGTGLDVILGFGLSLCPNVKQYSDYNPEKMAFNLKEDDTVTTYVLKMSLPTIMTIFFFSLGFNGTLWKAYGNVVDAMATAAENACDVKLAQIVDNAMNSDLYYQFHFKDGTNTGDFLQKLASNAYTRLMIKTVTDQDPSVYKQMGSALETAITKNVKDKLADPIAADVEANLSGDAISLKNANGKVDDEVAGLLNSSVWVDEKPGTTDGSSNKDGVYNLCLKVSRGTDSKVSIEDVTGSDDGQSLYIHVQITRDASKVDYFDPIGNSVRSTKNGKTSNSGSGNQNQNTEDNEKPTQTQTGTPPT